MIRGLEGFLQEAQLLQEESLSALKNTRLGIDLSYYLRHILASKERAEPLVTAIGGPPLALVSHIEEDLRVLEQHRIKPVFVLNGLSPAKRTRPFSYEDRRPGLRNRAWEAYEAGNVTLANQNFAASNSVHFPDLYRSVLRMIRHRQIDYVVAPYQATGQLVLMERHAKQYVHAIYGPMELFAFDGIDNVILHLNLRQGKFQFASKRAMLRELQCGEAEFLDTVLLAGMEYCSTFPALQDESTGLMHTPGAPGIRALSMLVKQSRGGFMLCSQFAEHPMVAKTAYLDQFCHARAMIKFSLVLSPDGGVVVPLPLALHEKGPKPEIPSDLHEIFSFRLPDQVLLYLSRGLISSSVLGSLLSGYVIESAPLDNGDTEEYRQFVREYLTEGATSPRCVAIARACGALHPFWRQRKVSAVYWFQPQVDAPVPHDAPATQQLLAQNDQWHVPAALLDEELRRQNSSTIDLPLCLNTTADPVRAQRTFAAKDTPVCLERKDEMVANTFWRMLELRGFLSPQHTHTAYGRALHVATQQLRVNDRLQEPLYLALELIRAGVLHGEPYSGKSHSGGPSFGTDEEMQHVLLAMRAMSLIPMAYKPQAWEAPLSRELLVFNSFAKSLSRSLRSLAEMVTLSLLLSSEMRQQRDDYLDISLSLPFQADTNTGMGIVFKCYLDALYTLHGGPVQPGDEASADVAEAKSTVVDMLVETFENVRDVGHELRRAGRFWAALTAGVDVLANEKAIDANVVEQFHRADAQLQPMWLM
ncbi:Similar to S.cerevisiae protein MKT1 (Protein similar to nucleases that forms a complex with Pbp1p) [Malassezia sympodialis ATCC 42132]|uniref:Similar to S.cerevisiae protein MKT1 (Protein similar to nucleases that forms a complex with Pbp1p) n=1 Tax=Malassezia sympodialis (strain ATCC 42132) TaxID=1230383 RepID=A0A1M8A3P4_MALS4|nr:Similar to S.cerevisiae protein MKT1 (Protein similar to nucleases that forms a complex with Pbp1p) [Malassezia sympodialis ATCC 42132]